MTERTTVRLPEDLLLRAKRKAAAEGRTLTSLIEDGLRMVTAESRPPKKKRILPPISTATGGLRPGIDLSDTAALQEMDDFDYAERMKRFGYPGRRQRPHLRFPKRHVPACGLPSVAQHPGLRRCPFRDSRLALSAVVRITTDRRIFKEPSAIEQALAFCENLLGQPHCQAVDPGERHWGIF
jgi:hypothetical protein